MLVVAGTITFDPAHQQDVVAAANRVTELTRLEEGCLSYEFFADLTTPGRIHVFEEWQDEDLLDAHSAAQHIADFHAALRSAGIQDRDIRRYHVSSVTP